MPTREDAKKELGLTGRMVLLTFGLLSPGKGIEHVIEALPRIAADHPDVLYVVLGATHPRVRAEHGETYRQMLVTLTRRLRMEGHVVFHDRFVDAEELTTFLGAADVYLTPYLDLDQATSGTLAYAVGAGRATISSPYRYAEELLSEGRGRLVAAGDSDGIARGVCEIASDAQLREDMERAAGLFGREMRWPVVASAYARIFAEVVSQARREAASGVTRLRAGQRARRPSDRAGASLADASELVRGDASSGGATEAARGAPRADASELV
ncbi:MAG: glycosyltransferase, partial [Myxococcota bacterium]|nr:glycosyltransferase [Myxococcota bacterium]